MKFRHLLICVLSSFVLGNVFAKNAPSSSSKFFLKYKDKFCLYPENIIETNKFEIASDECDKIAHTDERKIIWLSFDDDRIRAHNGLCLKTFKNLLVVSSCSPNPDETSEKWKIDNEQHLKNEKNQCAQMAGNKLFSFNCNKLSTTEFELKKFSEEEMNLMKTRYAQKKLENISQTDVLNLQQKSSAVISSYNDIAKEIEHMVLNELEIEKEKINILQVMNEIKLILSNSSMLREYGTGALMVVYDSIDTDTTNKKSLLKIPLDKLEVNENLLRTLGLEQGEMKIVISSFLNVPEENKYTFVAKNIKEKIIIKLGNNEIISNENSSADKELTSALIHLPKNILIPITIEMYSTSGKPSFSLYWSNNNLPEQIITSMYLYTTIFEKVCYPRMIKTIECSTTFENVQNSFFWEQNQEMHFLCPSECFVLDKYPIYKKKNVISLWTDSCYDLKSSICGSAVESNFISNNFGGSISIIIKEVNNENGNIEKCGFVVPNDLNNSAWEGITDIKLVDTDDFFTNFETNKDIYRGYKGIVSDDKHALLSKTDPSKKHITDIDLHCEGGPINKKKNAEYEKDNSNDGNGNVNGDDTSDDELNAGSFIVRRGKSSDLLHKNESVVADVFALFENYKEKKVDITIPGWTRKSCNDIQLFLKYKKANDLFTYPSLLLSCNDTFENISFENSSTINARCLPFCDTEKPIIGSFIYSPHSPICKSAIHSGVITYYGGIIEITKIENITQHFQNTQTKTVTRNNVEAIISSDEKNTDSYYISKPTGILCNYPRNSFNINQSLNADEAGVDVEKRQEQNEMNKDFLYSFLEMETPPASLVTMKHAMLQDQLHKLHHVYSKDEYKQKYFPHIIQEEQEQMKGTYSEIDIDIHNPQNVKDTTTTTTATTIPFEDMHTKTEFLKLKESFQKDKIRLQNMSLKTQAIFADLLKKGASLNTLSNELTRIRIAQKRHLEFLKDSQSSIIALIKQFGIVTEKKKRRIGQLEKALKNIHPLTIETFKETYASTNINNNYIIIDSRNNINGPSNWKIEKITKGNLVSAITNDSSIRSTEYLYGTYLIKKYTKLCRGFFSTDVQIPYMGSIGIIFKYVDDKNYSNFVISRNEYYFVEVTNGVVGKKIKKKELDNAFQLGNWTKILIDFGNNNARIYINDEYVTGYKTEIETCGLVGFGINGASEKVFFDKIVIGSLDQEKYYKKTMSSLASFGTKKIEKEEEEKEQVDVHSVRELFDEKTVRKKSTLSTVGEVHEEKEAEVKKEVETEGIAEICKPFEEKFQYPLETNWLTQEKSTWEVTNNSYMNYVFNKQAPEDTYMFSKQHNKSDILTPSIILLNTQNICKKLQSYLFQALINVDNSSKAGFIFRIASTVNFLSFIVDVSSVLGKLYLLKIKDGVPYQLVAPTHVPIKENTWYKLKMHYDGAHINVIFNDETVFDANVDESTPSTSNDLGNVGNMRNIGNLGLIVLSGQSKFKNIRFIPNPKGK